MNTHPCSNLVIRVLLNKGFILTISYFDIIQLMHSFEVDIRICQPVNSDVHRGEAEVNITFEG